MIIILKLLSIIALVTVLIVILIRSFNGKTVAYFPVAQGTYPLLIIQSGYYSLWVNSKAFRGVPLDAFHPQIINEAGAHIKARTSYLKPNISNKTDNTSMQLQYYYLHAGNYLFSMRNNDSEKEDALTAVMSKAISNLKDEKIGFQIKKTYPEYLFPLALLIGIIPILWILISLKPH